MSGACFIAIVAIAAIDWFTGPDLQVLVLYIVPVVAAAWYVGPRAGTVFAGLTAVSTFVIALATPGGHSAPVAVANGCLRLLLLLAALRVVAAERRHMDTITTIAEVDPLTRALNRRAFAAAVETRLTVRDAMPGTLLYLDVDGLKALNDEHGHEAGDRHLQDLADIIRASIRTDDVFARMGGDEFAVFLTGQDVDSAHAVAARLLTACAARPDAPIRLSIGMAPAPNTDAAPLDPLLRRADDAMYEAKRSGGGIRVDRRAIQGDPADAGGPVSG